MEIESVSDKRLQRFIETGNGRGLDARLVERLRKMVAFLVDAENEAELTTPPNFGAHQLSGPLAGVWSLTVTRNWRMTFRVNEDGAIVGLKLEDYH